MENILTETGKKLSNDEALTFDEFTQLGKYVGKDMFKDKIPGSNMDYEDTNNNISEQPSELNKIDDQQPNINPQNHIKLNMDEGENIRMTEDGITNIPEEDDSYLDEYKRLARKEGYSEEEIFSSIDKSKEKETYLSLAEKEGYSREEALKHYNKEEEFFKEDEEKTYSKETLENVREAVDMFMKYRNIFDRTMPSINLLVNSALEVDNTQIIKDIETIDNTIIQKLKAEGVNAMIDKDTGNFVMLDEEGNKHDLDIGFINSILPNMFNNKFAITGAMAGYTYGGAIGASLAVAAGALGPQASTPEEYVTVPLAIKYGSAIGSALGRVIFSSLGASLGSGGDYTYNLMNLKDTLDTKVMLDKMKDEGILDATMTILLGAGWKGLKTLGSFRIKHVSHAYKLAKNGNIDGATKVLLKELDVDENTAKELTRNWRKHVLSDLHRTTLFKSSRPLNEKEFLIKGLTETMPGGEIYIKESGKTPQYILHAVNQRAQDLQKSLDNKVVDHLGDKIKDKLIDYQVNVGKYYRTVTDSASEVLDRTDYRFNMQKLALNPVMENLKLHLVDDNSKQIYSNIIKKMDSNLHVNNFSNMLELRQSLNGFKNKIKSKHAQDSIKKGISKIDKEIQSVTDEYMGKERAKVWRQEFKKAKITYSKMKMLEKNYLYKAITRNETKSPVTEEYITKLLSKTGISLNDHIPQILEVLPAKYKGRVERSIIQVNKNSNTYGEPGDLQGVDFPKLYKDISQYNFTDKVAKQTVKEIGIMADIFKNDKALNKHLNNVISIPNVHSGIGTSVIERGKVQFITKVYRFIAQIIPTKDSDRLALLRIVGNMMDSPLRAKNTYSFMNKIPKEHRDEAKNLVGEFQKMWVESGANTQQSKEALKLYKASKSKESKRTNGGFGPGYYYKEMLDDRFETRNILRGDSDISELANIEDISRVLGREIDIENVRKLKSLPKKLKKHGYKGIRNDGRVMLFDKPKGDI